MMSIASYCRSDFNEKVYSDSECIVRLLLNRTCPTSLPTASGVRLHEYSLFNIALVLTITCLFFVHLSSFYLHSVFLCTFFSTHLVSVFDFKLELQNAVWFLLFVSPFWDWYIKYCMLPYLVGSIFKWQISQRSFESKVQFFCEKFWCFKWKNWKNGKFSPLTLNPTPKPTHHTKPSAVLHL